MKFCPGCARVNLRTYGEIEGGPTAMANEYESPCSFYEGMPRDELIEHIKDDLNLTPDELNQVLKHYGYEVE